MGGDRAENREDRLGTRAQENGMGSGGCGRPEGLPEKEMRILWRRATLPLDV